MLTLLESNPNIAACQPKILSFKDRKIFEYAGAAGEAGWITTVTHLLKEGYLIFVKKTTGNTTW